MCKHYFFIIKWNAEPIICFMNQYYFSFEAYYHYWNIIFIPTDVCFPWNGFNVHLCSSEARRSSPGPDPNQKNTIINYSLQCNRWCFWYFHNGSYWRIISSFLYACSKVPPTKSMKLIAVDGKEMLALEVCSAAIKYVKDLTFGHMNDPTVLEKTEIQWVLLVPPVWDTSAKRFTEKAAEIVSKTDSSFNQ